VRGIVPGDGRRCLSSLECVNCQLPTFQLPTPNGACPYLQDLLGVGRWPLALTNASEFWFRADVDGLYPLRLSRNRRR